MKSKRPLPKAAVLGGIPAVGLLFVLVGWMLVVSPQNKKATSMHAEIESVQKQITDNLAAAVAARTAVAAPKIRVADVYKLAKAMPSAADMPNILLELDQVARDSGVELQAISPGAPAQVGAQSTLPITLNVVGNFYTLTDLLYRLRNLVSVRGGALQASGRLFSVDSVNLSPTDSEITASITMHTYIYGPPAVTTPAVPVTPSPTDTTSTTTTPAPTEGVSATGAP